jgi:hypothetical protein
MISIAPEWAFFLLQTTLTGAENPIRHLFPGLKAGATNIMPLQGILNPRK